MPITPFQAGGVASRTADLLDTKGWCLWQCEVLGGEVVAIVRDEDVQGVPKGYVRYLESELKELFSDRLAGFDKFRVIHEAKRIFNAEVTKTDE